MSTARLRGALLAAALTALAIPALAPADQLLFPIGLGTGVPPQLRAEVPGAQALGAARPRFRPAFVLEQRHGLKLGVIGFGDAVIFEVVGAGGDVTTAYVARGTVTPTRIQASFGELGSVSMRFRAAPHQPLRLDPGRDCARGGRFLQRRGVYLGSVRFRGEGGYVSVNAHRARGRVSEAAPGCRPPRSAGRAGSRSTAQSRGRSALPPIRVLVAGWRSGVDAARFGSLGLGDKALFFASTEESKGDLAKLRFAFDIGLDDPFTLDSALTFARVSPPQPFAGNGTYRAAADGTTTWTGKLAVNFPDARVPFAGPPFEAELAAGF